MDRLVKSLNRQHSIRFIYADVTQTAHELAGRHGADKRAAEVLGGALAGAALLSADSSDHEECLSLQLMCDGPVRGVMAEATGAGTLRGFTNVKRLAGSNGGRPPDDILGKAGVLQVILSTPGKVIYSGQVNATPPDLRTALARYYNQSLQTPTGVEMVVRTQGESNLCRALAAQRLPAGSTEAFVAVLERFNDGSLARGLEGATSPEDAFASLPLKDIEMVDSRALSFACRCSKERVVEALASLSAHELRETIDGPGQHEVSCHMCGEVYIIRQDVLLELLLRKGREGTG